MNGVSADEYRIVGIDRLIPSQDSARLEVSQQGLNELADSIREVGILEPIVVRPRGEDYEIVAGRRRFLAGRMAGLGEVPVIVKELTDEQVAELALIENVQREDLNDVEKGRACIRLLEDFPEKYTSLKVLANSLGLSSTRVSTWIRVARDVPEEIQRLVSASEKSGAPIPKGKLTSQIAVDISRRVKDSNRAVQLATELAERQVPVHTAREVIKRVALEAKRPAREIIEEILQAPTELPFRLNHIRAIQHGIKVQTTRKGVRGGSLEPGDVVYASVYEPRYLKLVIEKVERKRLGEFTEEDAEREGGYTLSEFREVWDRIHPEGWDDDLSVMVIHFKPSAV